MIPALLSSAKPKVASLQLYQGSGADQTIATPFTPDMAIIKDTYNSNPAVIFDKSTGLGQPLRVVTNDSPIQKPDTVKTFSPFVIGNDADINTNNGFINYAALFLKESAGFFDIIENYLGDGTTRQLIHNLGVVPEMIMTKSMSGQEDFAVYHKNLTAGNSLRLNKSDAQASFANEFVSVSSTDIFVGSGANVNRSGFRFNAYLFASKPGVSWLGSYIGNGLAAGPVIDNLSFYPRLLWIKRIDVAANWHWYSRARNSGGGAPEYYYLRINVAGPEASGISVDFLNAGFQPKTANAAVNASGGTYIVMALA